MVSDFQDYCCSNLENENTYLHYFTIHYSARFSILQIPSSPFTGRRDPHPHPRLPTHHFLEQKFFSA